MDTFEKIRALLAEQLDIDPAKITRMKQMYKEGLKQGEIAKSLGLCRKTVNKYLQCIKREEPQCNLSPLSC